ncbi:MAG: CAP domain-containing protein [Hyphomicrobium sp.]|jgi:hypothetical protein
MPAILPDTPTVEAAIVQLTNAFRHEHQLGDVVPSGQLTNAARAYASYLATSGQFSHTADGRQAGDRVASAGYAWCQVGENLALHLDSQGFESRVLAEKSVQGWINSPGHRANMLAPYVTQIGVGVARAPGQDPKYLSVQLFARPKSLQYEFQISNTLKQTVSYSFGGETHEVEPSFAVTHTACNPGEVSFEALGTGATAKRLSMRYQASDGLVYMLKPDKSAGLRVEVAPLEKVSAHNN